MMPFDWRTPFGYVLAWLSEICALLAASAVIIPVLSVIFASSWLFIIIADDDLTRKLAVFNNNVKALHENGRGRGHKELMQHFCGIVQLHLDSKE